MLQGNTGDLHIHTNIKLYSCGSCKAPEELPLYFMLVSTLLVIEWEMVYPNHQNEIS